MDIDLSTLNPEQYKAVTQVEGPYIINAGPGSGKTQVLTYRIAYLMQRCNVPAYCIMALTFTNKAAKEMQKRIQNLIQKEVKNLWIGTFHSLFARILRIEASVLALPQDFTIYDRTDSLNLIKVLIKELALHEDLYKANVVLSRISGAKNRLMDAQAYSQNISCQEDDKRALKPRMAELFLHYQNRCKKANALDFDDLLLSTYHLLSQHRDIAKKYQQRFEYLLVDEFQDTNEVQYAILKILASHQNLCVIGDDAQSIYAFRGANIDNILSFTRHFPEAQTITLGHNYRSTQYIVQAVNSLIQHNKGQLPKNIFTENAQGDRLVVVQTLNEIEEGLYVAKSIFDTSNEEQASYDQFAILYRTNSQSRVVEEQLRKYGISYSVLGSTSFYQRKEIKDLLAYLRILVNPNDEQALRRIINLPKRGIGPTTLQKIFGWATAHDLMVWEVLEQIEHFMHGSIALSIKNFVDFITPYHEQIDHVDAYTLAYSIAKKSGLITTLYQDKTPEGVSRYENVQELLNSIKSFVDEEQEENRLVHFLEQIALVSQIDQEQDGTQPTVSLMTIHTAKGLEFPYVYIVGMEEKLFPASLADSYELEEERRLFYVALTRAQKKIHLIYSQSRYRFGQQQNCKPSRFLKEIDPSCIQIKHLSQKGAQQTRPFLKQSNTGYTSLQHIQAAEGMEDLVDKLQIGKKIRHPIFGLGTIQGLLLDTPHQKITINFQKQGAKTLLLKFANLEVL